MIFQCPYCRDTGTVTTPGRLPGDRIIVSPCEDCRPKPDPDAESRRLADFNRIEELLFGRSDPSEEGEGKQ